MWLSYDKDARFISAVNALVSPTISSVRAYADGGYVSNITEINSEYTLIRDVTCDENLQQTLVIGKRNHAVIQNTVLSELDEYGFLKKADIHLYNGPSLHLQQDASFFILSIRKWP